MLTDLASVIILSAIGSNWDILSEMPESQAEGWDALTISAVRDYGAERVSVDQVLADWPIGRRIAPGRFFWVTARRPKNIAGNVWGIEITALGAFEPSSSPKFKIDSVSQSQSFQRQLVQLGTIIGTPGRLDVNFDVLSAAPTLTASYFKFGELPETDTVGRAGAGYQTPPLLLPVRPAINALQGVSIPGYGVTAGAANNTININIPNGWFKSGMSADVLRDTDIPASYITESWEWREGQLTSS